MQKILIIIATFAFMSTSANAQLWKLRRYEVTAGLGTTQFYGDIGGYSKGNNLLGIKDFSFKQTRFNFSTAIKYRILNDVSVRLNLAVGGFHSTDSRGSNESRGFESSTTFFEPAVLGEYYFIKNKGENSFLNMRGNRSGIGSLLPSLDVYVFGGFGSLWYKVNPNEKLAPFVTRPSGFTAVLPVGFGVNMFYSSNFNFGVELGARYIFSDNIEGYSSIYSKSNDSYHFLNFTFTYKINTGENGLPRF